MEGVGEAFRQVARFNETARALTRRQSALQAQQDGFNAAVLQVNGRCGGRVVPQDVIDEVERELKGSV